MNTENNENKLNDVSVNIPEVKPEELASVSDVKTEVSEQSVDTKVEESSVQPLEGADVPVVTQNVEPQVVVPAPSPQVVVPNSAPTNVVTPNTTSTTTPNVLVTEKKQTSNFILFIGVAALIAIVYFMEPILGLFNKSYVPVIIDESEIASGNLVGGYIKIDEPESFMRVENIKFYGFRKTGGKSLVLSYESSKNHTDIAKSNIYIEIYDHNKKLIDKKLFNPEVEINKGIVKQYTINVSTHVYDSMFYAYVKKYSDTDLEKKTTLNCTYEVSNNDYKVKYVNTYSFVNDGLVGYTTDKNITIDAEVGDTSAVYVAKVKDDLKNEYLNIIKYNIEAKYTDNSLKYSVDLGKEIKDFVPYFSKGTSASEIKDVEKQKDWICK